MSLFKSLQKETKNHSHQQKTQVNGEWRAIKYSPNPASGESLNIGVTFKSNSGHTCVRMLDHFERIKCLYDHTISDTDFHYLMEEIEHRILKNDTHILADSYSGIIDIGPAFYAQGDNEEKIVDSFYDSIVTLGKERTKTTRRFRPFSAPKLRHEVLDNFRLKFPLTAEKFIQEEPYNIPIRGSSFPTDLPLVGENTVGAITSAYYKSTATIGANIMHSITDITMARMHGNKKKASLSLLRPGKNADLSQSEFRKINTELDKLLFKVESLDITLLEGISQSEVSEKTANWWEKVA